MSLHRVLRTLVFIQLIRSCVIGQQLDPASLSREFLHDTAAGTRWALLVAGSSGYVNYRHQADVCHAFQILKNDGLREENIIVFMYDDIAFDPDNPTPGVIINRPNGDNVYQGVPKDYTGENATVQNLFAVMLGNRSGLTGGSGKILDSGPQDHIFIYYSDHGSPGMVEMTSGEIVYADDLVNVLKKMHERNAVAEPLKDKVFYLEACESGSMFDGLLPETLNIYAITAANPTEDSFATYCPDDYSFVSPAYGVCLGDVYSVAWMEDSERHDLRSETLGQQLQVGRRRTAVEDSHVMQYGSRLLSRDTLSTYLGTNTLNDNYTWRSKSSATPSTLRAVTVSQREADLLYYRHKVKTYEEHCGPLSTYGRKYVRVIANMCNSMITVDEMNMAVARICK